jgi:lysophospholipase L1-like esterase
MLRSPFVAIGLIALACGGSGGHASDANGADRPAADDGQAGTGTSGASAVPTGGGNGSGASGGVTAGGAPGGLGRGGAGMENGGGHAGFSGGSADGGNGLTGSGGAGMASAGRAMTGGGRAGAGGIGPAGQGGANGGAMSAGGSGATSDITVWLAGDSTMANGETPCPVGWGKVFAPYFNDHVTITNSAVGGASIRTWLYNVGDTMDSSGECVLATDSSGQPTVQAHWTQMLAGMKQGDYLIIQFGINDGDPSCNRHVGLDAFKESLGVMAQAAKDKGATPIFVTPVSAIACNGTTAIGTRGGYVSATTDAGAADGVSVIDLHALSVALYNARGFCPIPGGDVSSSTTGPVGDFFCDDHTHFETAGATVIAGLVAQALHDENIGLAAYLN